MTILTWLGLQQSLPVDRYPRQAKNQLHYLLGVQQYNKANRATSIDERDAAFAEARKNFEKVSSKSSYYLPSRYIEGIIFNQQEKFKSAVRAFRDVYREEVDIYNDAREVRKMNDLKDLSLINIASIYYGIADMAKPHLTMAKSPDNLRTGLSPCSVMRGQIYTWVNSM